MLRALIDNNLSLFESLISRTGHVGNELDRCLIYSIQKGDVKSLNCILRSPDVFLNSIVSSHKSTLMLCAESGSLECLRAIINDRRCKINSQNKLGETALNYAVRGSHVECVEELLRAGADDFLCDNEGSTPLILASKTRHPNPAILKLLLRNKSIINAKDSAGRTALHYTCGQAVGSKTILEAGADPDVQDGNGNTPLHVAAVEGFDSVMTLLVSHDCNVNLVNSYGRLALHYIAMKGHWKVVETVAQAGGLLDVVDGHGKTPLIMAIENNRIRAIMSLLVANCSPDAASRENGAPPLEIAFDKKFYHLVKLLLLFGARPGFLWKRVGSDSSLESRFKNILLDTKEHRDSDFDESLVLIANCSSLQNLCRIKIREIMRASKGFDSHLKKLPKQVHDYVLFKNTVFSAS